MERKTTAPKGKVSGKTAKQAALHAKIDKKKKKEKRKKIFKIVKWTSILLIVAGLWLGILYSKLFDIKNIEVYGNEKLTYEQVVESSKVQIDQNMFKYFKHSVIKNLESNPYIESVTVKRKYPSTVVLNVKERTLKYILQYKDGYAYINSQGYILELSTTKPDVPEIKGYTTLEENLVPGQRICVEDLQKLSMVIKLVDAFKEINVAELITYVNIKDENDYSVYIDQEKKLIKLGDGTNLSTKMLYIKSILESSNSSEGTIFAQGNINKGFKIYFREETLEI